MRKFWSVLILFIMVPLILIAQVAVNAVAGNAIDLSQELPLDQFIALVGVALGGIKGASGLALAALVVQVIMAFFRTKFAAFAGKYRLLIVYGLSVAFGVLALKLSGVSLLQAFLDSNVLAAAQVFLHQGYTQFIKKADEPKAV